MTADPYEISTDLRGSIARSLCFGLYVPDGRQVGFARTVTDRAAIAYLADVFVSATASARWQSRAG